MYITRKKKGRKTPSQKSDPKNPETAGKTRGKDSAYPGLGQNAQRESPGGSPKREKTAIKKKAKSLPPQEKTRPQLWTWQSCENCGLSHNPVDETGSLVCISFCFTAADSLSKPYFTYEVWRVSPSSFHMSFLIKFFLEEATLLELLLWFITNVLTSICLIGFVEHLISNTSFGVILVKSILPFFFQERYTRWFDIGILIGNK